MQVFVSNKELEQLAEGLIEVIYGKPPPKRIDIAAVAAYLCLTVIYERIAEDDKDKIGFVSDGKTPLTVSRNGKRVKVVYPKDTIVLDSFLLDPREITRHRFVLAHEISHVLLNRADPLHNAACFNRVYDTDRQYELAELRERMNLGECQANSMAAIILMPRYSLTDSVRRHIRRKTIPVYGDCIFLPKLKPVIQRMEEELGVSHTSLIIQLRKYNLLEQRDMSEYFAKTVSDGGDTDADADG